MVKFSLPFPKEKDKKPAKFALDFKPPILMCTHDRPIVPENPCRECMEERGEEVGTMLQSGDEVYWIPDMKKREEKLFGKIDSLYGEIAMVQPLQEDQDGNLQAKGQVIKVDTRDLRMTNNQNVQIHNLQSMIQNIGAKIAAVNACSFCGHDINDHPGGGACAIDPRGAGCPASCAHFTP